MSSWCHQLRRDPSPRPSRFRVLHLLAQIPVLLLIVATPAQAAPAPWEPWRDLLQLTDTAPRYRAELRSSYCPDGCRYDRLGAEHPHILRREGKERVLFDDHGPGAITRIWMTSGKGTSSPLPAEARVRFYFGNAATAQIDLPLPGLFDGTNPPFAPPLAWSREQASGGNYSLVPIPYDDRLRVTLEAPEDTLLWYQFHHQRAAIGTPAEQFQPTQPDSNLDPLRSLLAEPGGDPWRGQSRGPGTWRGARSELRQGDWIELRNVGPGLLTAVRVEAAPSVWRKLQLRLHFDGKASTLRLADLFGDEPGSGGEHRSLFARTDGDQVTLWLPMPYHGSASVELGGWQAEGRDLSQAVEARLSVRSLRQPLSPTTGVLRTATVESPSSPGSDLPILEAHGATKWVGVFADLSARRPSHFYLEGDEHVFVDQSPFPTQHGTGTEDFYAGGFYYEQQPFAHALVGLDDQRARAIGQPARSRQYRWFLGDAPLARAGITAGLEPGANSDLEMLAKHTALWYEAPPVNNREPLTLMDTLVVGDADARSSHDWQTNATFLEQAVTATYPGPQDRPSQLWTVLSRGPGRSRFVLASPFCRGPLQLRRVYDAELPGQVARVELTPLDDRGSPVGSVMTGQLPFNASNPHHRWAEHDLILPLDPDTAASALQVEVFAAPENEAERFSEVRWELWCTPSYVTFANGFESGDVSGWSSASRPASPE